MSSQKIIEIIVEAAENKKAVDIKVINLKKASREVNSLVIMTGESTPQLKAISREIEEKLKDCGMKGLHWEGPPLSGWMILDAGSSVVHVMLPKERKFYNLEELWGKEAIIYHY